MVMAFLLMIIFEGQEHNTQNMYFRDINRCNYFAEQIEKGNRLQSGGYIYRTDKIDAYCLPKMVSKNTEFWD